MVFYEASLPQLQCDRVWHSPCHWAQDLAYITLTSASCQIQLCCSRAFPLLHAFMPSPGDTGSQDGVPGAQHQQQGCPHTAPGHSPPAAGSAFLSVSL